jgi:hypothetical protein
VLYRAFLQRDPSAGEVAARVDYLADVLGPLADGFAGAAEFQARVPAMF